MFDAVCKFLVETFSVDFARWLLGEAVSLTESPLVYATTFEQADTRHRFEVIRLWEQPVESFLQAPGLLPFAVLSQTGDRPTALRQAAQQIEQIRDRRTQSNLSASAAILAGLVLEKDLIRTILMRDLMQESVIYQDIRAEAIQEGRQVGLQEGLREGLQRGEANIVRRLLTRRIGPVPLEVMARVESLSLEQIEALAEALLEFQAVSDLAAWIAACDRQGSANDESSGNP
jgi:predicted transposase YdaD